MYRKFYREKKYRPYVLVREFSKQEKIDWRAIFLENINVTLHDT